ALRSPVAGKARVHELAKELNVSSKDVLAKLSELGEFVKSASSTVEAPVARKLREAFPAATAAPAPRKVAPSPAAAAPPAPAPAPASAAPVAPSVPTAPSVPASAPQVSAPPVEQHPVPPV